MFYAKRFFRNFTKFNGKYLWHILFFNNVAGLSFPQSKFSSALKRLMRKSHIFILVKLWFNSDTSNFFSSAKYMLIPQDANVHYIPPDNIRKPRNCRCFQGVLKNLKENKFYGPFLWMGFNCLKATATSRRHFTFHHSVPRNSWYSLEMEH